jgi:hypothetical protein
VPRYIVMQDDGVESDPVSGREVVQWIRDGRIGASTLIRDVRQRQWHRIDAIPALKSALPSRSQPTALQSETTLESASDSSVLRLADTDDEILSDSPSPKQTEIDHRDVTAGSDPSDRPMEAHLGTIAQDIGNTGKEAVKVFGLLALGGGLMAAVVALAALFVVGVPAGVLYLTGWTVMVGDPAEALEEAQRDSGTWYALEQVTITVVMLERSIQTGNPVFFNEWGFGMLTKTKGKFKVYGLRRTNRFYEGAVMDWIGMFIAVSVCATGIGEVGRTFSKS